MSVCLLPATHCLRRVDNCVVVRVEIEAFFFLLLLSPSSSNVHFNVKVSIPDTPSNSSLNNTPQSHSAPPGQVGSAGSDESSRNDAGLPQSAETHIPLLLGDPHSLTVHCEGGSWLSTVLAGSCFWFHLVTISWFWLLSGLLSL